MKTIKGFVVVVGIVVGLALGVTDAQAGNYVFCNDCNFVVGDWKMSGNIPFRATGAFSSNNFGVTSEVKITTTTGTGALYMASSTSFVALTVPGLGETGRRAGCRINHFGSAGLTRKMYCSYSFEK